MPNNSALIADSLIAESSSGIEMRAALAKRMDFIELGGLTTRCHTMPTIHPQTVAAHSFGVAWWCWLLTNGTPSAALLLAALAHDLAEHVTGDIPSPAKTLLGISKSVGETELSLMKEAGLDTGLLTNDEEHVLKLADALELMQYCYRERSMGNRHSRMTKMFQNISEYLIGLSFSSKCEPAMVARRAVDLITNAWGSV